MSACREVAARKIWSVERIVTELQHVFWEEGAGDAAGPEMSRASKMAAPSGTASRSRNDTRGGRDPVAAQCRMFLNCPEIASSHGPKNNYGDDVRQMQPSCQYQHGKLDPAFPRRIAQEVRPRRPEFQLLRLTDRFRRIRRQRRSAGPLELRNVVNYGRSIHERNSITIQNGVASCI